MREIELSTMVTRQDLKLDDFEASSYLRVRCEELNWDDAWNRIVHVGIYQKGPDVSEVGNTWTDNLDEMHALRPFQPREVASLGGKETFATALWRDSSKNGIISIPFMVDSRYLFYRRDLLAKAGINEATAFLTTEALLDTLNRLRAAFPEMPGQFSMNRQGLYFHNVASWIWGRGGDFRSPDGHKLTLLEPEARTGLLDYFRLHEFLPPALKANPPDHYETLFYEGKVAVLCSGNWVTSNLRNSTAPAAAIVRENVGAALPPGGVPYLGGSHLVIWRHTLHEDEDMELVRYLVSAACQKNLLIGRGSFPARQELYNQPPISTDPILQVMSECVRRGRSLQSSYRWAAVETRLNDLINRIWVDLFANPELNLEKEMDSRLRSLIDKLEKTVLANW